MRLTTQSSSQIQTIFGSGYVSEQSGDETAAICRRSMTTNPLWISAGFSTV